MEISFKSSDVDWAKEDGLVPVIVQHDASREILMLGYMNAEALAATTTSGKVTFFSRSKQRLWQKGETSGNVLQAKRLSLDCDGDTILVEATPAGPTCHLGSETCFGAAPTSPAWLSLLEGTIRQREQEADEASYTFQLLRNGPAASARKVGEEAVELAVAALDEDGGRVTEEAADLVYHLLVLLRSRGIAFAEVVNVLKARAS
jgi:phosphoribosyl-ATP pyrophosphohydrolase/phosphoribosyl-AMP cyclohydrolase